jgi:hypothetical protein
MRTWLKMLVLSSAALCATGCIATEVDQSVDCRDVCDRYSTCYNASYDTAACRNRCEGFVDTDGHSQAANACDACMDDTSCAAAVFTCSTECSGILP